MTSLRRAQKEREYFIENLVMLLSAGIDITLALETIIKEISSVWLKKKITGIKDSVTRGSSLHDALGQSGIFRKHIISLIRLGEESGRLVENLGVITIQQKKERRFNATIHSALTYPVFIIAVALIVSLGVTWYILPNLATIFSQLNLDLPLITRAMLAVAFFLKAYGIIAVPLLSLFVGISIYLIFFHPQCKRFGQSLILEFPGIGPLVKHVELARMGYITGTLLGAGVPIVETLSSLQETAALGAYSTLYTHLKKSIEKGHSFKKSFSTYRKTGSLIPLSVQQMVITAEESRRLPEIFLRIGELFEEKTENGSKELSTILEPLLLIFVWLGVVGIALAVILPIYQLIGKVN